MILTQPEFLDQILIRFYQLMHTYPEDNYDSVRNDQNGVDGSSTLKVVRHKEYLHLFTSRYADFYKTYALLADERSRDLFIELILFRLLGHTHVKLSTNTPESWVMREEAKALATGPSSFGPDGPFGPFLRFAVPSKGETILIDCCALNVYWAFLIRQYFFSRDGVVVAPGPGDHVLDIGACFGESALSFATSVGQTGVIHSFDFMPQHVKIFEHNIAQNPGISERFRLYRCAVSDEDYCNTDSVDEHLEGMVSPSASMMWDKEIREITPVVTIDTMVDNGSVEKCDFIKMDVEGAEMAVLKGAQKTLREQRPRLAVSLYHRPEDFIDLPQYIASLDIGYRFYLDHYTIDNGETVLYAIAS